MNSAERRKRARAEKKAKKQAQLDKFPQSNPGDLRTEKLDSRAAHLVSFISAGFLTVISMVNSFPLLVNMSIWLLAAMFYFFLISEMIPLLKRYGTWVERVLCIALIEFLILGSFLGTIRKKYFQEQASVLSGEIVPSSTKLDKASTEGTVLLQVGDDERYRYWATNPDHSQIVIKKGLDFVKLHKDRGTIMLSSRIEDKEGHIVLEIQDNHWKVAGTSTVVWDKNYDANSLEVLDGGGRVVFQVRMYADGAQIQTEFPSRDLKDDLIERGKFDREVGITRMFHYPSSLHWGKLNDSYKTLK